MHTDLRINLLVPFHNIKLKKNSQLMWLKPKRSVFVSSVSDILALVNMHLIEFLSVFFYSRFLRILDSYESSLQSSWWFKTWQMVRSQSPIPKPWNLKVLGWFSWGFFSYDQHNPDCGVAFPSWLRGRRGQRKIWCDVPHSTSMQLLLSGSRCEAASCKHLGKPSR